MSKQDNVLDSMTSAEYRVIEHKRIQEKQLTNDEKEEIKMLVTNPYYNLLKHIKPF